MHFPPRAPSARASAQAFGLQRLPIVRATSHLPPGLKHPNLLTRMLQVFPLDPPPWLPKVTISGQQNAPTSRFSALLAPFSPGPFAHLDLPWPCQLDDSTRRETAPIHDSLHHMLSLLTLLLCGSLLSRRTQRIVNMKRIDFGWGWGATQANFAIKPRDICAV